MLQGYDVTYSVHPLTDGLPTIALYSACVTIVIILLFGISILPEKAQLV